MYINILLLLNLHLTKTKSTVNLIKLHSRYRHFMKTSKTDRRIIRSKTLLKNALRELMGRKGFKYITVKEISDISTINRATFYKHYFDVDALLVAVFQEDFHRLLDDHTTGMKVVNKEFISQTILAVSDFLLPMRHAYFDSHHTFMALAQKTIQEMLFDRFISDMEVNRKKQDTLLNIRLKAAMTSCAIHVAVGQWIELSIEKKLERKEVPVEALLEKVLGPITGLIK